jgi:predicted ATPase
MPELLRVKGDLLLLKGESEVMVAECLFRQALDLARQQGALSYELRAAMSLARQRSDQGRPGDAVAYLQPVYDRFYRGLRHGRPEVGKSAARYSAIASSAVCRSGK